jgi:hypothetical protein
MNTLSTKPASRRWLTQKALVSTITADGYEAHNSKGRFYGTNRKTVDGFRFLPLGNRQRCYLSLNFIWMKLGKPERISKIGNGRL